MNKKIENLATIFKTDKFSHGYMSVYMDYFDNIENYENILEIGIKQGESLKLLEYIFPSAVVYGIDINIDESLKDYKNIYLCDQENREQLSEFTNKVNCKFDIIIDDGGHYMKQQQISFGFLFEKLNNNGIYIIEDLHTSLDQIYKNEDCSITTLEMLNVFNQTQKITSNYIFDREKELLEEYIDSIFIWSKTPDFTQSVTAIIKKK